MAKVVLIKIKLKGSKGAGCYVYKNQIILEDYRQVACLLLDLETYGGQMKKAIEEFFKKREEGWPF